MKTIAVIALLAACALMPYSVKAQKKVREEKIAKTAKRLGIHNFDDVNR